MLATIEVVPGEIPPYFESFSEIQTALLNTAGSMRPLAYRTYHANTLVLLGISQGGIVHSIQQDEAGVYQYRREGYGGLVCEPILTNPTPLSVPEILCHVAHIAHLPQTNLRLATSLLVNI